MKKVDKYFLGGLALAVSSVAGSLPVLAADLNVKVDNLTRGIYFTPLLVAAHEASNNVFEAGAQASENLLMMAEGGNISGLSADLAALGATIESNPAGGLLAPGASTAVDLNTDSASANTQLSVVAMMLPTNDGFIGLNAISIPTEPGSYTFNVNAYDAGTEANNELVGGGAPGVAGYPAPGPVGAASGSGGTGVGATAEGYVHIHRNNLGDDDATGGVSDMNNVVHRWLNPVARVTITVR
jgi:hypothetical protein